MGRYIKVPNSRHVIAEVMRHARRVPSIPVARRLHVGDLAEARASVALPHSWSALFLRAYGMVCARFGDLRRAWIPWPRPRLYEHPHTMASVAVEREWRGEQILFFPVIEAPEHTPLPEIQRQLHVFKQADVASICRYRRQLLFGRLPRFLQRLVLWHKLDVSGPRRVRYAGTTALTNYGMLGSESLHPIGPQTTVMTLGPIAADGTMTVKLVYDHRVVDGGYVARALGHLDDVLHTSILEELRHSPGQPASIRGNAA